MIGNAVKTLWIYLSAGTLMLVTWVGFFSDLGGAQSLICNVPLVHTACGKFDLGGVPSQDQVVLFNQAKANGCKDLYQFMRSTPNDALKKRAREIWISRRVTVSHEWKEKTLEYPTTIRPSMEHEPTKNQAIALLLQRARSEAQTTCRLLEKNSIFESISSQYAHDDTIRCHNLTSGWTCEADGTAICRVRELVSYETAHCE